MSNKIYKLIEAFSMQPSVYYVGMPMPRLDSSSPKTFVERIIPSAVTINGETREVYAGYDNNEKLLFYFLKETVNVMYY